MDKLQIPPLRTPLTEANGTPAAPKTAKEWYLFFAQARDSIAGLLTDVTGLIADVAGLIEDVANLATNAVKGAPNLLTPGAIPKVGTTAGALVESAVVDNGTTVLATARNIAINASTVAQPVTGRVYFVGKGTAGSGIELQTSQADADLNIIGGLQFVDINSTAADKRVVSIAGLLNGTVANNRGGLLRLLIKTDGGGLVEAGRVNNLGQWGLAGQFAPAYAVDVNGDVNASGVYRVGGTQVVGARGAALTASGAAVAAAPAAYNQAYEQTLATAINNLITRVNELQARLQAHGLIA